VDGRGDPFHRGEAVGREGNEGQEQQRCGGECAGCPAAQTSWRTAVDCGWQSVKQLRTCRFVVGIEPLMNGGQAFDRVRLFRTSTRAGWASLGVFKYLSTVGKAE
jgi:hypothetical protein